MSTNPDTSFDAIVAAFGNQLRCEATTHTGGRCLRLARWRIDLHGCEEANMCGHHKCKWLRREHWCCPGPAHCPLCDREFPSLDDAVRVIAI